MFLHYKYKNECAECFIYAKAVPIWKEEFNNLKIHTMFHGNGDLPRVVQVI
jgi:hypothetical protein